MRGFRHTKTMKSFYQKLNFAINAHLRRIAIKMNFLTNYIQNEYQKLEDHGKYR